MGPTQLRLKNTTKSVPHSSRGQALSDLQACQHHIDGNEIAAYYSELRLRCAREDVEELHQEFEREQNFKIST